MQSIARPWSRSSGLIICKERDMICWQLVNMIICVRFRNLDGLELEGLDLEADLVIFEISSSSTPPRLSDVTICQGRDTSWRQPANLIICVGLQNIYGSDLEEFILKADLVIFEIPPSSTSLILTTCSNLIGPLFWEDYGKYVKVSEARSDETKIFWGVVMVISGSRSQLSNVKNRVLF